MAPKTVRIYTENNDFQYLETLRRNRTKRHSSGEFFVEGVRAIDQALAHGWQVNAFAYHRDQRLSDWASGILAGSEASIHYEMPAALMAKISQKTGASELVAILAIPPDDVARIPETANPLVVVLDRIMSPGNLGTLIRSCDALGADGVIVTGHSADAYAPETIRATTGSFFAVPVVRLQSHNALRPWLAAWKQKYPNLRVAGTSASAETPIQAHDFTTPTVLLVGNENHGLSQAYRDLADVMVTIPMHGAATSMNVACAASVLLYEINRQRK